jgi:RNA polymerase sigma-70 factor (ECF subfamily)
MTPSGAAAVKATFTGAAARAASDLDLVKLSKRGDRDAFGELVRRHQHIVYNVSYRFMRDSAMSEDMAQEAFVKAFRLLSGFRGDCSFSTWMYRVTCSVCLTELSRRKKRGEVALQPKHVGEQTVQPDENFDMPELVRRCVNMLPDRYATIMTLYYLQGVTYDEIAQVMDIPMGTLKTWMHRARKQLKKIVQKEIFSDA